MFNLLPLFDIAIRFTGQPRGIRVTEKFICVFERCHRSGDPRVSRCTTHRLVVTKINWQNRLAVASTREEKEQKKKRKMFQHGKSRRDRFSSRANDNVKYLCVTQLRAASNAVPRACTLEFALDKQKKNRKRNDRETWTD